MWISALSDALVALTIFFVRVNANASNPWPYAAATALALGVQHFVLEGIAFILMQYGCGHRALRVSALCGAGVGSMTFLFCLFFFHYGESSLICKIYFGGTFMLFSFYFVLWAAPEEQLFRRPAITFYAKFWTLFQLLVVVATGLQQLARYSPAAVTVGTCLFNVGAVPIFVLFKPVVMYRTLLMESQWWQ
ncbi:hypothetical protein B484DRAFT_268198 [Ochromonadaceae sp. CCMP2298]|nr:hypothetical protein B484DRAFT_268198 [Ochromonadaceae sp. CCMP2298]